MNRRNALTLGLLVALVGLGVYGFTQSGLDVYFTDKEKVVDFVRSFYPIDEIVFISLQVLQVVFAPVPGEATGLIGGYLYGPILGTIYSTIGLTIGSWLAFILARFFGGPLVKKAVKPETINKYDNILAHEGTLISFFLFLIPGFPKDCLCYLMGLSHMNVWVFLMTSTVGRLFGTLLLSYYGSCARRGHYVTLVIILIASSILTLLAYLRRDLLVEMAQNKKCTLRASL
jgi:uncharacterized membrane protein YdjX (TVP38/TMEM64 family)